VTALALTATFLGHAGWLLETGECTIAIDPFLRDNPVTDMKPEDLESIDFICVTHAHGDHLGDTVELARSHDALVISTFEVANMIGEEGVVTHGMHIGGTHDFAFGTLRLTPAFHGSGVPGGHAAGFVITTTEGTVYHAGDTSLFGDMKLLDGVISDGIDIALLPIGSNFTMGIADAVTAAKWIKPRIAVPMHYDTFPVIEADPNEFKKKVEAETETQVQVLAPGEKFSLK
jgi:L-ascorbate metabolism protein UlaG (beta-lactamase superfamily)